MIIALKMSLTRNRGYICFCELLTLSDINKMSLDLKTRWSSTSIRCPCDMINQALSKMTILDKMAETHLNMSKDEFSF